MNQEKILKIKEAILRSNDVLEELAELYKVFGDSTRVKILTALTQSEMCVSEISEFLEITQSAVSPAQPITGSKAPANKSTITRSPNVL
jgi:ArsR family transcriptional regulator